MGGCICSKDGSRDAGATIPHAQAETHNRDPELKVRAKSGHLIERQPTHATISTRNETEGLRAWVFDTNYMWLCPGSSIVRKAGKLDRGI